MEPNKTVQPLIAQTKSGHLVFAAQTETGRREITPTEKPEKEPMPLKTEPGEIAETEPDEINLKMLRFEQNHTLILAWIQKLLMNKIKPTVSILETKTGLSRPTIYKHLEAIGLQQKEEDMDFKMAKMLKGNILLTLAQYAMNGNLNAIKCYVKIMGLTDSQGMTGNRINIKNANLQYNNYQITPEMIKKLSPQTQAELENMVNELSK